MINSTKFQNKPTTATTTSTSTGASVTTTGTVGKLKPSQININSGSSSPTTTTSTPSGATTGRARSRWDPVVTTPPIRSGISTRDTNGSTNGTSSPVIMVPTVSRLREVRESKSEKRDEAKESGEPEKQPNVNKTSSSVTAPPSKATTNDQATVPEAPKKAVEPVKTPVDKKPPVEASQPKKEAEEVAVEKPAKVSPVLKARLAEEEDSSIASSLLSNNSSTTTNNNKETTSPPDVTNETSITEAVTTANSSLENGMIFFRFFVFFSLKSIIHLCQVRDS